MDWWNYILIHFLGIYICLEQLIFKISAIFSMNKEINQHFCEPRKGKQHKVAIVTGGSSGIGQAVVELLVAKGYFVVSASNEKYCLHTNQDKSVKHVHLDLASAESVRGFCVTIVQKYPHIHLLVNCAGVMFVPLKCTSCDIEYHFAVNYFGHFLLTMLLLPAMKQEEPAHIITVTSSTSKLSDGNMRNIKPTHENYSCYAAYAFSKLAVILFTFKLQRFLQKRDNCNVQVTTYDPGTVNTRLYRRSGALVNLFLNVFGNLLLRRPSDAAEDIGSILDGRVRNAKCFIGWKRSYRDACQTAYDRDLQDKLWNWSMRTAGFHGI